MFREFYYKVIRFIERCQNFYYWGSKLNHLWDFEGEGLYYIIYLKQKRLHEYMLNNGHCVWTEPETKHMKRLAETAEIAKRLHNEDVYFGKHSKAVMAKYTCNSYNKTRSILGIVDNKIKRKCISDKLYSIYLKNAHKKDTEDRQNQKNRLYFILDKHLEEFWD